MKQLSEFATLADAQAYEHSTIVKIDNDIRKTAVETVFTMNETEERLEELIKQLSVVQPLSDVQKTKLKIAKAILRAINKLYAPEYYIHLNDPDVAAMFAGAEAYGILLADEIAGITKAATKVVKPYLLSTQIDMDEAQDLGEIVPLNNNDTQHKVTFAIATQPRKPVRIIIEQQFGSEGDLTEWHEVGSVTVNYTQRHYESGYLPAKPKGATIRNLRAVSPLTIGLSKV